MHTENYVCKVPSISWRFSTVKQQQEVLSLIKSSSTLRKHSIVEGISINLSISERRSSEQQSNEYDIQ